MNLRPAHGNEVAVILSEAKDLQFRSEANSYRFFASLRMTDFLSCAPKNNKTYTGLG
jgi:hypothetical protein